MASFITRCPHCETSFRITPEQSRIARGTVRCGFCLRTFSALEHQIFSGTDATTGTPPETEHGEILISDESLHTGSGIPMLDADTEIYPEEHTEDILSLDQDSEEESDPPAWENDASHSMAFVDGDTDDHGYAETLAEDFAIEPLETTLESCPADSAPTPETETAPEFAEEPDEESATDTAETREPEGLENEKQPEPEVLSSPGTEVLHSAIKKKAELQTLEALYDEDTLDSLDETHINAFSDEPVLIHGQRKASPWRGISLFSANLLLLLTLSGQYFWSNLEDILQEGRLSPITNLLCRYASCPPINRFDLSQFVTEELVINSHPAVQNALQVDFIFRNAADYPQSFPMVELNFMDINRRPLANRLFTPQEYLAEELQQFNLMPANSTVQIKLEIADPGPAAINYTLALRAP